MLTGLQAGLFSAVTSAFIVQVQPQLQPDTGEETASLLRVLVHKIDNTAFGGDVPTIPQWLGPPRTIIQVQAVLYASLATSLFSAFLAMLGKQWLNRYASIDMRGSAIERSQNRQRKFDGVVAWYFDHVMESLPLMLQFALFLLGCALSRYLWEIDTTTASVVLGATLLGLIFYIFIVVAGTTSLGCPYQTPVAGIFRRIPPLVLGALRSASSASQFIGLLTGLWDGLKRSGCSIEHVTQLFMIPLLFPVLLGMDTYLLAQATVRAFIASIRRARDWFRRASGWHPQTTALDLRCITWILQTSLDKAIHLSTLKLLAMMTTPVDFDPALVLVCFDIFAGCVSIVGDKVVIAPRTEDLAITSALCCLRALSHPTTTDPASSVFTDVQRRYTRAIPVEANFEGLPSYHHFCIIHNIFHPSQPQGQHVRRPKIQWEDYKLSGSDHTILTRLARFEYRRRRCRKVPRWILRFAQHILSQDPFPSASVVAECLSILALDLGCSVSNVKTLDERYVHS